VAPKINDSQIRRDLIWSVIREQRVVRGGHKEICELITEQVASEDISFMSRHFLQAVSGIDGAKSILLAGLRKRHAYSKDVPFIIFEMLSTDAPSTRLLQSASEWLANYGHASGSFRIAKLLIEHAERLVKEEALVELSELSDANVIIKNLWNWCNLVGPDGMAAPIVISLLQGNLPTNIDSTVAAMDWLRTSESHRTANVWEAVFDKMRRCHTKKSVGEASLQGAEDVAQEWLALNPHHPVAPAVIMLVCGLDYRVHPLGQGGYVANFNNRTWKLALLQEWLDRNPLLPGATFVLVTALKTKGIRRHIVAMAREWLSKQNAGELSVNFIELLIDEAASAIAKDKLARLNNKERTAAKQFSAQLRTAAVDWIVENCAHKGAGYLVGAFLAKAELLDDVIDFARSWIATNATNSTMSFAVMRLAEVSSEASDVDLVKNWLRERGEDNGASFVLTICLSQKTAAVFATTAIDWIDIHVDHPGVGSVLTALAKSNHGSAEFLVASLKRHIGELTPPAVRQFFFAFNLWVEDNYIKKHSVEISKDTRRALAEYVSLFADSIPPFGERDVHTIRCCVGTSFWSEELGIPHDRSDLRLGFESLASDLGSGRWLEMNLKRPNYSDLVAPVASKWVQNFPSEIFISYLVVPLLHMPATFPEIRRVVFEIVRSRTKLQGMPHVVQALLETDMSAEAVAIVEEWVQSSESVDGWTYLADLLVAHPGDVRKSLESLLYASLKSAGKRGLGDVGLPGVVVKTLYRFGWSPILEELVQAILMIGGHVSEHFVHSLQTISQHSRDRQIQLIVLRIFVRYVRRHAPEHLALHVALPLLSDPKPLLDELEHAHSGATVLAFTRPLLNAAAKDEHLLKLLLDWLNGSGRLWRRTLRIPVVEIAVRNPSFLRLIDEVLSNSVLIIDDKVRGNCEEAIRRAHSVRFRAASIKQPRILRAIARRFSRLFWWPSSH
jgi:hypothetical protein